ncbi:hypothetical protein ACPV40_19145 [Vibrio alfacsensis]|uniref:hypothetical protein n=1 Tax=Vibrio alfacsensis TaxID=1074311 RepID=UPI004068885A
MILIKMSGEKSDLTWLRKGTSFSLGMQCQSKGNNEKALRMYFWNLDKQKSR